MAKNTFKYRCDECGTEQMRWRGEFIRASLPRCVRCGSTYLDEVTQEAYERRVLGERAAVVQDAKMESQGHIPPRKQGYDQHSKRSRK